MRTTLIALAALIFITGITLFLVSRNASDLEPPANPMATAPSSPGKTPAGVPASANTPTTPPAATAAAPPNPPLGKWVPPPDPRIDRTPDGKRILTQPAEMSRQLHSPDTDTAEDIDIIDQILWFYRKVYSENPVVENEATVTQVLIGNNPKNVVFIEPNHPGIGENGALLDRFGNPYYFHPISGTEMDIISSGPDGKRGTPDDIHLDSSAGEELQLNENSE